MKEISKYSWLILVIIVGCPGNSRAEKAVVNQSGLVYRPNDIKGVAADYHPSHICSGTLHQDVGLKQIKLSTVLLQEGVECVAGDFDGNGFLDFALYQPPSSPSVLNYAIAYVIFFDGPRIQMVSILTHPPAHLWPAGTQGVCFRHANKTDALSQEGGGERDRTATFDQTTGKWKRDQCGGEDDGE
ncbi:MAG: hypothetical protein ACRESI_02030 [Gammaproteobacteria bacterium]